MKKIIIISCLLILGSLGLVSLAATTDFVADGDITVSSMTIGDTTANALILSGSSAQSWTYSSGALSITNPDATAGFKVGSSDSAVVSLRVANGSSTVVNCALNTTPGTSYVSLPITADTYTVTLSTTSDCQDLCPTLSNASSYNAYPVCGALSCATGYAVSGSQGTATCVLRTGGGAGTGHGSTPVTPPVTPVTPPVVPPVVPPVTPVVPTIQVLPPTTVNLPSILESLSITRNEAKEVSLAPKVSADVKELKVTATPAQLDSMAVFVAYGISSPTVKLGEGERRAVVRDYLDTVKSADINWQDIERITTGQKPVTRNLSFEQQQVTKSLSLFTKITGKNPDFKVSSDDLAWNTLMYRIRFTRDTAKEAKAITKFRSLIKASPKTPQDWAAVRAIAYTGIKTK